MKMFRLSEKLLKHMVKAYKNNNTEYFQFEVFKSKYPDCDDGFLTGAMQLLENDGFVTIQIADRVAYTTKLLPEGIRQYEKNIHAKKSILGAKRN